MRATTRALGAAAVGADRTHQVPVFEGNRSRRHRAVRLWQLRAEAAWERALGGSFRSVETFVQFAGFPRSSHSLIGSILDAHPEALVSHELDAMGLIRSGFTEAEVFALIRRNTAAFERHGRWWNGFSYAVAGGCGGRAERPRVIGDKKGDFAVRWVAQDPTLLDRLAATVPRRRRAWILVLRNPFDNIATMSLRKGRAYDRLRIEAASREEFRRRLKEEQGRTIAAEALPDMVADYAALCDGVAAIKARTPPEDWLEIRHEDLVAAPAQQIERLLDFLRLPPGDGFVDRTAGIVGSGANRSRDDVAWPQERLSAVRALVARHDFLAGYGFDD